MTTIAVVEVVAAVIMVVVAVVVVDEVEFEVVTAVVVDVVTFSKIKSFPNPRDHGLQISSASGQEISPLKEWFAEMTPALPSAGQSRNGSSRTCTCSL